jgi:hypothetical protein
VSAGTCTAAWTEFFLNSNGNLTFGAGSFDATPAITELLGAEPRIAPAWMDLNPAARGTSAAQFPVQALGFAGPNAFKVRWIDVPQFGFESCGGRSTLSVTLYDDGIGDDESAPGTPEGPASGAPRVEGSGNFRFDYCRMDALGIADVPIFVGYTRGGQDPATPDIGDTDLSEVARRSGADALLGDPTKAIFFESFVDGTAPAPQIDGDVELDLRFVSHDAALTRPQSQPDESRDSLWFAGIDCSATSLVCAYQMVIAPPALAPAANVDATLEVQGGVGPYGFAVTAGTLPAGVALDPQTGRLTGGATQSGSFAFDVTVTDANGCTTVQSYTLATACAAAASFASMECRLDALAASVAALPSGKLVKRLAKLVKKADRHVETARTLNDGGRDGPAKRRLVKAERLLTRLEKTLASKKAQKVLAPEQRTPLSEAAAGVRTDSATLRTQI